MWSRKEEPKDVELDILYSKALAIAHAVGLDHLKIAEFLRQRGFGVDSLGIIPEDWKEKAAFRYWYIKYVAMFCDEDQDGNSLDWDNFPPLMKKWRSEALQYIGKHPEYIQAPYNNIS